MPFLMIFIIIPLIEVALFMAVGDEIGIFNTLILCVVTAIIGAFLLRAQGLATLLSARSSMAQNQLPINQLFDGFCLAIAGVTLMTPGFFTDMIGFALLIPVIRTGLRHNLSSRFGFENIKTHGFTDPREAQAHKGNTANNEIIEGDFKRIDNDEA